MKLSPDKAVVCSTMVSMLLLQEGRYVHAVDLDIIQAPGFGGDPLEGFSAGDHFEYNGEMGFPSVSGEIYEISRQSEESLCYPARASARVTVTTPIVPPAPKAKVVIE